MQEAMTDSQQDSDGAPTRHMTVDVAEAARRFGVTPDTIRSRLRRGILAGEKIDGVWQVHVRTVVTGPAPDDDRQDAGDSARQDGPPAHREPLAETIERLSRRNEELRAAVGMWQARAHHLEEQMQQLAATAEAPASPQNDDDEGEAPDPEDAGISPAESLPERLRRWMIGR